jgi:hypothetical protein
MRDASRVEWRIPEDALWFGERFPRVQAVWTILVLDLHVSIKNRIDRKISLLYRVSPISNLEAVQDAAR